MKTTALYIALPLAAFAALVSPRTVLSQDEAKPSAKDPADLMEAYMKLIAPGPEHKELKKLVGNWSTKQKLWMSPGAPPQENVGTAKFRMAMGGRYLVQTYAAEIPGMGKFVGRGTTAYDKVSKEYVSTWIDSLGTGIMISRGKVTDTGSMELRGEAVDPFTKEKGVVRTVSSPIDAKYHKFEMFEKKGDADERKIMEIVYTRTASPEKKGSDKKTKAKKVD